MKIKNSVERFDSGILLKVFFFSSLLSVVLRCLQMFRFIEPETGFNSGPGWLMALLYVIVFGSSLFFCVGSYLGKSTENYQPMGIKNERACIITLVFVAALAGDWISSFFGFFNSLVNGTGSADFRGFMASGVITNFFQSIFAFFAAIYFVIVAFDFLRGTHKANRSKLLALAPVGWASIRLVHRFIRQISFIEVSDLLFELVMLSCLVLFFMAFAQVASGVNSTGFGWRLSAFGLSAALIAITVNSSRLVYGIVMGFSSLNEHHLFSFVDIAFAIFALALICSLNKKTKEV